MLPAVSACLPAGSDPIHQPNTASSHQWWVRWRWGAGTSSEQLLGSLASLEDPKCMSVCLCFVLLIGALLSIKVGVIKVGVMMVCVCACVCVRVCVCVCVCVYGLLVCMSAQQRRRVAGHWLAHHSSQSAPVGPVGCTPASCCALAAAHYSRTQHNTTQHNQHQRQAKAQCEEEGVQTPPDHQSSGCVCSRPHMLYRMITHHRCAAVCTSTSSS